VQLLSDQLSSTGLVELNDNGKGDPLLGTLDAFADELGNIYATDTGRAHVYRYDPTGAFTQGVDVTGPVLKQPVAVTADSEMVFVADPGLGQVIRYRRSR
jgi:hypothetical protein